MRSDSQRTALARSSETYHAQLGEARLSGSLPDGVRSYFSSHAVSGPIMRKYSLGYVAQPLPGEERFRGMISIPYITPTGVVAVKYRDVSGYGQGKYAQQHGQKGRLYNTSVFFSDAQVIGICEGEMDAIAASEHIGIPSIGVPGVEGWKGYWAHLLKDFRKVFIFADGDTQGREFAWEMAETIGWRAQIVKCPDDEDVSSLAAANRLGDITTSIKEEGA